MKDSKLSHYITRKLNFEFWPFWFFYIPLYFYAPLFALRSRSWTYFTATNPGMKFGGVIGESKASVLEKIGAKYLPKSVFLAKYTSFDIAYSKIQKAVIGFPLIAKPNVGERGRDVEKIETKDDLEIYISAHSHENIIIQEFIDYDLELGVMYHRLPEEKDGKITSIVIKDFLTIEGDGETTIAQMVKSHIRAYGREEYFEQKLGKRWNEVLAKGENLKLEPIGNHCRGTTFLDGNHLNSKKLENVFDRISNEIDGYYYGRFDLKVKSMDDLYEGKNIKILELNGVSSEPAHIYDPSMSLFTAYRDLFNHAKIIWKISKQNHKLGVKYTPLSEFLTALISHLSNSGEEKKKPKEQSALVS